MKRKVEGFTLVEIMIVVAIIGILAAIAIPNFFTYQSRSKQAEVKMQLKAIYTAELSHFTENETYTDKFADLPWKPESEANLRYTYALGPGPANMRGKNPPTGVPENAPAPGASKNGYTCVVYANIDSDTTIDTWYITNKGVQTNTRNDVGKQ